MVAVAVACGTADSDRATTGDQPIVNGTLDTKHPAVMAIISIKGQESALCSGTMVKTDPAKHIGWVATAAHCVDEMPPVVVLQAQDYGDTAATRYYVIDAKADSRYTHKAGSPYDFAVIRVAGVDEGTPVLPLLSGGDDGLDTGDTVTSVGYGRTVAGDAGEDDANRERHEVSKTIKELDARRIGYDMTSAGFCFGDSGGPVVAGTGSNAKIVGIHSYIDAREDGEAVCAGLGYSGRVSVASAFFTTELSRALPTDQCLLCGKQANSSDNACAVKRKACLADTDCAGYYNCIASKKSAADCKAQFPDGEAQAIAAIGCVCNDVCKTECTKSPSCHPELKDQADGGAGACDGKLPSKSACNTCLAKSCCAEVSACEGDATCKKCAAGASPDAYSSLDNDGPECLAGPRVKLSQCSDLHCSTECSTASSSLPPGSDFTDPSWQPNGDESDGSDPVKEALLKARSKASSCSFGAPTGSSADGAGLFALALGLAAVVRRKRR